MQPTTSSRPSLGNSGPGAARADLVDEGYIHCTDGEDELIATANRHT
jgi:hypothetical protein